jgi:hypothetical protein
MKLSAQKRAMENYRRRLSERGVARFEVQARESDRELIRALARRLTEDDAEAQKARAAIRRLIDVAPPSSIFQALRRSPLVEAELDLARTHDPGRAVDL